MRAGRAVGHFAVLVVAAFGPLAPVSMVVLFAAPPLLMLSGWPIWLVVVLIVLDVTLIGGTALLVGPGVAAEARRARETDSRAPVPPTEL